MSCIVMCPTYCLNDEEHSSQQTGSFVETQLQILRKKKMGRNLYKPKMCKYIQEGLISVILRKSSLARRHHVTAFSLG